MIRFINFDTARVTESGIESVLSYCICVHACIKAYHIATLICIMRDVWTLLKVSLTRLNLGISIVKTARLTFSTTEVPLLFCRTVKH